MLRSRTLFCLLTIVTVLAAGQAQATLITNGGFEYGNQDFQSDYVYWDPATETSNMMGESRYSVQASPLDVHIYWTVPVTPRGNKMLLVNGATSELPNSQGPKAVWKQSVEVVAGKTYSFSVWATGVYSTAPANLQFKAGSEILGTMQLSTTIPLWQEFTATFTAPETGSQILSAVYDLETEASGNDFALDDISLTVVEPGKNDAVPEPTALAIWGLFGACGFGLAARRRRKAA